MEGDGEETAGCGCAVEGELSGGFPAGCVCCASTGAPIADASIKTANWLGNKDNTLVFFIIVGRPCRAFLRKQSCGMSNLCCSPIEIARLTPKWQTHGQKIYLLYIVKLASETRSKTEAPRP
jgi:hypothetical protein